MTGRSSRLRLAAVALCITIPVAAALSQTQTPAAPPAGPAVGLSPELRGRLDDGRIAMVKEALRLDHAQLKLWAPVEAQLRATYAAREKQREERRVAREGGERLALPDRLDRMGQRMAERAERTKALAEAFRPFYAALNDEQKALAGVVMRQALGGHVGRRGFMRRASGADRH